MHEGNEEILNKNCSYRNIETVVFKNDNTFLKQINPKMFNFIYVEFFEKFCPKLLFHVKLRIQNFRESCWKRNFI